MTMEPKDTTVLVYDNGHNIEVAIRLSKDCKRVLYYTSWSQGGFPERNLYEIGRNIPGVERIENFWGSVDDADVVMFTDIYIIDGTYYVIPIPLELQEIGSVVATGNSLDDAMNKAKSIIGEIKGDGLEFHVEKFDGELKEEIAEMGKMGLDFFNLK